MTEPTQDHHTWEDNETEELKMALESIRQAPVPMDSLEKTLIAASNIPMTRAAWKRGFTNAFLAALPTFLFICVIVWLLVSRFGFGKLETIMFVSLSVTATCLAAMVINYFRTLSQAGTVLIDCGPCPGRKIFVFQIMVAGVIAGSFFLQGLEVVSVSLGSGFLLLGVFWAFMASSRLQICEGGIRLHYSLLPWKKIDRYEWKAGATPTLLVTTKSKLNWYRHGAYPVPEKFHATVDDLLKKHVDRESAQTPSANE